MRRFLRSIPARFQSVFSSIRFRLTMWFVIILGVVLLVFSVFVYTIQARDLQRATLDRLANKIRQLQSSEEFTHREPFENGLSIPNISQDAGPLLQQDDILAVTDAQGAVVQKYGPISSLDVNQLAGVGISRGANQSPFSYTLVSATTTNNSISRDYTFIVAPISFTTVVIGYLILGSPVDPDGQLRRLVITLLTGGLGTLVVALAGGYWLADRALRPVKTITRAARQISETDLSRRLNLTSRDEIGQLANTFDQMIARLQAAFERQRQFTADASHELRTPLTIVNLEAGRALAAKRSIPEYERALSVIRSENEWMTRLVNNLLTLSRMDAGQAVLEMNALDLSDLALEAVERLAPIATRNQVVLTTGDLPELKVNGDRQFLIQMLVNLVENAIKYTTGPERCVNVSAGCEIQGKQPFGWVSVQDNGPGIAPEHLPRLFDRFYQVDKARSHDADEGTDATDETPISSSSGLGLAIVQRIAHAHGGEVSVQSEIGIGSTFMVRLPLVEEPQIIEKTPAA